MRAAVIKVDRVGAAGTGSAPGAGLVKVLQRDQRHLSILLIHNSADMYGASRSLLRLARELEDRGTPLHVVLPEPGPLADHLLALGVPHSIHGDLRVITRQIYASPVALLRFLLGAPLSVWRLCRLIRATGATVVHTNTGVIVSPALAAALCRVPHIWHIRDWFQEFRAIWPVYEWYVRTLSSRVICVSSAVARQFKDQRKLRVINNGLPLSEFEVDHALLREQFRRDYCIGADEIVIGTVGRIKFQRKGQEVLVRAAERLKVQGLRVRYLVVGKAASGNEDHEVRLRSLIAERGLDDCFVLTGELLDPRPAYAAMDVFVLPSAQPEPFGGVVLEAMAIGRPVIATAIGGSPDQVSDGQTGFLVPPNDDGMLAEKLAVLVRSAELRRRMGIAARDRFVMRFTISKMLDSLFEVYRDVGVEFNV